jgi:predicted nuclease of predicted toxin-antitoxin system
VRLKLDENLPVSLRLRLAALGYDVDTVLDEGLKGKDDRAIWHAAQRERRVLVTQDLDFSDVRTFIPGMHEGIVLFRIPEERHSDLKEIIVATFALPEALGWQRCFVVVTPAKIRVLRPTSG